jgi:hypothetical protein
MGSHADVLSNRPPGALTGRGFAGIIPKTADALLSRKKRLAIRQRTNVAPKAKYTRFSGNWIVSLS